MRDAFELHPELQSTIEKIDKNFAKPNVMCKTMWNKLKDINNSNIPLITEGKQIVNILVRKNKNGKTRTTSNCSIGADIDAAIAGKLKTLDNVKRYEVVLMHSQSYNTDIQIQLAVYCNIEESKSSFDKRQSMLSLKKLFVTFINEEMKLAEQNAAQIKKDKIALKQAFDEEMKLLKQKYMQK